MGPNLDHKERSEILMEHSPEKESISAIKEPEEHNTKCPNGLHGCALKMKALLDENMTYKGEDVEVDIFGSNFGNNYLDETRSEDATEHSSSFADTISEVGNGGGPSDDEVVSESHAVAPSSLALDEVYDVLRMRRKRLTSHWRSFVQALMWRCKWVELQIKKLETQAGKYDRELNEYNKMKISHLKGIALEDMTTKSLPFSGHTQGGMHMRRRKRKRSENSVDVSAYMSHHNLFSYYENRSATNGALTEADRSNLSISTGNITSAENNIGVNVDDLSLHIRDGDNRMEQILWEIGCVQSRISLLKTRVNEVITESAAKFSTTDILGLSSSTQKSASTSNNGDRIPVGSSYISSQLLSHYSMRDVNKQESSAPNEEEVTPFPNIIQSTNHSTDRGPCKNVGILVYNRRAKEELKDFKRSGQVHVPEMPQASTKEELELQVPPVPVFEDLPADQPPPKIRSISTITAPKSKRPRGKRKAGSGKWNRRSSR